MAEPVCRHCGLPVPPDSLGGSEFCCAGCRAAFDLLHGLGLDAYYERRVTDPNVRPLKPEDAAELDLSPEVRPGPEAGTSALHVVVDGLHCAACVWLVETLLKRHPAVVSARLNMTTRRLRLVWRGGPDLAAEITRPVREVGYRLLPFDPSCLQGAAQTRQRALLRAMAVAGFAAANVMLLSVAVWSGSDMGPATRDFLHWISALIALPAIAYAIRPFLGGAWGALRHGRMNMDVPIVLAVALAAGMSLWETAASGVHAYFDSACALLFFLLIGRYLDALARGRARAGAENLLTLSAVAVTVERPDGGLVTLPPERVAAGEVARVAPGDRIGIDGVVESGRSDVDAQAISGETTPVAVAEGSAVHAGTLNLSGPLRIRVTAAGEATLLAEIVRLMEAAEQGRAKAVALADRAARLYAPVVHALALAAFLWWFWAMGAGWQESLLTAISVLIVTCPCALALAVPAVQVIASGRLFKGGILVKSGTALERLERVDTVVFDKTGTLTTGTPQLAPGDWTEADLAAAAELAAGSRHPLARALAAAAGVTRPREDVREAPGEGLAAGAARLGRHAFAGGAGEPPPAEGPELWWRADEAAAPVRFAFTQELRPDAAAAVAALRAMGIAVSILSGDREAAVEGAARQAGISDWRAACRPADKVARLAALRAEGRHVAMVGDGLNDAPALAAAEVSLSPASAADLAQTAADVVFQGGRLSPVAEAIGVARRAGRLVRLNFAFAVGYNLVTVPLAMAGLVTPLIAAAAMSTSSLVVMVNAMRLAKGRSR
ncbi:heavy metal translocating P-type ATPase metal-binding domain-containing protein [Oleispirillum naphthae]|uniref:heavy metal translocating P-type ATPase metal-binding domain-containing protein n=1 Tax=Oleispirillum naphthae TaxID=2838853 RepID=UPI00308242A0